MFSIIVFGCVTSQGWRWDKHTVSEVCIIHDSYSTCRLGSTVAILAFILSIGILVCEFYFEQLPTTANRKQVVVADLVFSGQPSLKVGSMTLRTVFKGYSQSCSSSPSLASPISGVSAKSPGVTMAALISGQP